jgi:hypothetical protein
MIHTRTRCEVPDAKVAGDLGANLIYIKRERLDRFGHKDEIRDNHDGFTRWCNAVVKEK